MCWFTCHECIIAWTLSHDYFCWVHALAGALYYSGLNMNSMKLVFPSHFISCKKTPNDAVTPQRQSQFTPKMKANAILRLLSSLVWIDQYNECNGLTSFMEFMISHAAMPCCFCLEQQAFISCERFMQHLWPRLLGKGDNKSCFLSLAEWQGCPGSCW